MTDTNISFLSKNKRHSKIKEKEKVADYTKFR